MERVSQRYEDAVPVEKLRPHPLNANLGASAVIAESIGENGFYGAVYAHEGTGYIVAGNHRWEEAVKAGADTIPVIWLEVDEKRASKILAVDNRSARLGSDDDAKLAALLESFGGDYTGTGYGHDDLDALLRQIAPSGGNDTGDTERPIPSVPVSPVSLPGDVWLLGRHRVACGDCRDDGDVKMLLVDVTVNIAVTSPPYADRRDYDETTGFRPIPPGEYVEWFEPVSRIIRDYLADDGSWFLNIKPGVTQDSLDMELYVFDLVLSHVRGWGWHLGTEYCWERNGVPKTPTMRFKNQWEPVFHFAKGKWKFRPDNVRHESDNVPMPGGPGVGDTNWANAQGGNGPIFGAVKRRRHGTTELMSGVQGTPAAPGEFIGPGLAYPGNRLPTFAGSHEATGHTAAFPVGLPKFFIEAYSDPGDVVYDPFVGSGSTILAAEESGRIGYGMELSPGYVDVTCRRFQEHTGIVPILERTGEPCDFIDG